MLALDRADNRKFRSGDLEVKYIFRMRGFPVPVE